MAVLPPALTGWRSALARVNRLLAVLLSLPIHLYRLFLSPLLPRACRHEPSCSRYALEALAVHGPWRGTWLTIHRIVRCAPWGTFGFDPVPPRRTPPALKDSRSSAAVTS